MKKFLITLLIFIICQAGAYAEKLKAVALNEFATTNPNADIKVYVYEDFYLHSQVLMPHGSVLVGKIANISQPKPGMNAGFKFVPIYYMDTLAGVDFVPTEFVDITDEIDLKLEMLECHKSQLVWMREHDGIDFADMVKTCSKYRGYQCGAKYAEGFRQCNVYLKNVTKRMLP